MRLKSLLLLISVLLVQIRPTLQYSIVLDVERDLWRAWKLSGPFVYLPNGLQLKQFYDKFPHSFNYHPFLGTKGIWATFPQIAFGAGVNRVDAHSAELLRTANNYSASSTIFAYTGAAQLIESVSIRHCMNGRSNITVTKGADEPLIYTIDPGTGSGSNFEWISTNVPLGEGSSRFVVQANVNSAHDFVLVDRIEGFFVEVTTVKPKPTHQTTTAKPPGSDGMSVYHHTACSVMLALMFLGLCL